MDARSKLASVRLQSSVFSHWALNTEEAAPACSLPVAPLTHQRPPGLPILSSLTFSPASALSWLCLLFEGKSQISLELPAACQRHHLSIPYSSNSTSQTCHFLTKPTSAPSPEFFLSNGGSTIPPTTQPGNCKNQP